MAFEVKDINNIAQVAADLVNGKKIEHYAEGDAEQLVYNALVEANNGKNYIDPRDLRDGKCAKLFALVEVIIKKTVVDGVKNNPFLSKIVETRVVNAGDKPEFHIKDANWYTVSKVSGGNQALRRQRIIGDEVVTIPTAWHAIKVYEEMERLLSGSSNMSEMIADVSKSFNAGLWADIAAVWQNLTKAQIGGDTYDITGSWDETAMV